MVHLDWKINSPCESRHRWSVGMFFSLGVTLPRNAHTVRMLIMRRKRKRAKEEAYMLGELRNKVRSVYHSEVLSIR